MQLIKIVLNTGELIKRSSTACVCVCVSVCVCVCEYTLDIANHATEQILCGLSFAGVLVSDLIN